MDWQPIVTAPKDGTRILAYDNHEPEFGDQNYAIVYFDQRAGYWTPGYTSDLSGDQVEEWPTHWMPLPEPPR